MPDRHGHDCGRIKGGVGTSQYDDDGNALIDGGNIVAQTGMVSDAEKEPTISNVVDRLAARFPDAPWARIAGIVGEEYDSLDTGRIRIYIPTLVEHGARTRLHREFSAHSLDN